MNAAGCKLFGAYRTAVSVKDAAVLIHSTVGCNWGTSAFHIPSRLADVRQASSVLYEEDIIYGGRAALEKALGHMSGLYDCRVIFVLSGCVAEIMEDDLEGILRGFPSGKPIIPVKAAGFKGDMASGAADAMGLLIGTMAVKERKRNSINLVGIFSDDFRSDADLGSIEKLLGGKVEINAVLPYDSYGKIVDAPGAGLNVVFEGFEDAGRRMEREFGIPYIVANYPYGIAGTRDFAVKIAEALGLEADKYLKEPERQAVKKLETAYGYIHKLYGMPAAVRGDAARAKALRAFLQNELGMVVEAFCAGSSKEEGEVFEKAAETSNAAIIFGSSYERGLADRLGIPLVRCAYPVFDSICIGSRGYAGFDGTINLAEDIINAIMAADYRRGGMFGRR